MSRVPHRYLSLFANRPQLIEPEAAAIIADVLTRRGGGVDHDASDATSHFPARITADGQTVTSSPRASGFVGDWPIETEGPTAGRPAPYRLTSDGVAIVRIVGEMVNRGQWIGASSGLVSYEGTKHAITRAAASPKVKSILLDIQSPGGEALGCFDAAATVRAARAVKPVIAVANGMMLSAAYALGSQASEIFVVDGGYVGSIGVVWMHVDMSKALSDEGYAVTLVHAGAHKVDGHPYAPLPDDVRTEAQRRVDETYGLFVAAVAAGRGARCDEAKARATEARVLSARDAVAAGLADRIGSFEDALAYAAEIKPATTRIVRKTETAMTTQVEDQAAAPDTTEQTRRDERARIDGIMNSDEARDRQALASHFAFKTDMSVEAARAALSASAPEKSALADLGSRAPTIELGTGATPPGNAPARTGGLAAAVDRFIPPARRSA
jgi:capsid assembly protease